MKSLKMLAASSLAVSAFAVTGCATSPYNYNSLPTAAQGAMAGAVAGAVVKSKGNSKDIAKGAAIGAAIGGGAGLIIDQTTNPR